MSKPTIAINYYFGPEDLNNRIFEEESKSMLAPYMRDFREFMRERGIEVATLDTVDYNDPDLLTVLYFEYNWRMLSKKKDPFLSRIPYEKRTLLLIEPAIINPTLYYTGLLRNRFSKVFTWDLRLLEKNPEYVPVYVPVGAEPRAYRENRFADVKFSEKKLLVSVSRNRWHYHPLSTFALRRRVYRHLQENAPSDFDLFGLDWERPCSKLEKLLGRDYTVCWRGEIPGSWDAKVEKISRYKFSLCFENSVGQPGYLSEKIFDCFCARTVPIYYGSRGNEKLLPEGAFIDWRDFKSPGKLLEFLKAMDEETHAKYVERIDGFMQSPEIQQFSNLHLYETIFRNLTSGRNRTC